MTPGRAAAAPPDAGGRPFVDAWRRLKSAAFDLESNSTAGRALDLVIFGKPVRVYANANLSIYSGQTCNARCPFCVEELRPASRGAELSAQRDVERDDRTYFERLERVLDELRPLDPSVSVTGGEPSKDPRLPEVLRVLARRGARKRTMTTNGSGLLDVREGRPVVDWVASTGVRHLNISRAHPDHDRNARIMGLRDGLPPSGLRQAIDRARAGGVRVRLSCVLLRGEVEDAAGIRSYLEFASGLGVDNVIFRQLMKTDPATVLRNRVTSFSDRARVPLEPLLDRLGEDPAFELRRQIVGYYYYVEVWRHRREGREVDVVFEEADLGRLEETKREHPGLVHELVFHPHGRLASTWQPWDGVLG